MFTMQDLGFSQCDNKQTRYFMKCDTVYFGGSVSTFQDINVAVTKKKQSLQGLEGPLVFQEAAAPSFQNNQHMKVVMLSVLSIGRLYPQEIFLVPVSVRG
jgi:hypothetical protein